MKINMYNWGRVYAFVEHYLPHPFPRIELERAAQAPMYYFPEWLNLAKKNKDFDHEQFSMLTDELPADGGVPTPTIEKERISFYLGVTHQRGEMMIRRSDEDAAE